MMVHLGFTVEQLSELLPWKKEVPGFRPGQVDPLDPCSFHVLAAFIEVSSFQERCQCKYDYLDYIRFLKLICNTIFDFLKGFLLVN